MILSEIRRLLDADFVGRGDASLEREIVSACASDLMSDVLAFGRPGDLLLTGLANAQSVRTADIIGALAIVYVRNKKPDEECVDLAVQKNIPLLSSRRMMYEACGILYGHGLPGACDTPRLARPPEAPDPDTLSRSFEIMGRSFARAGSASMAVKEILEDIGIDITIIRRAAVAAYEAEMNIVMYADRGVMTLSVTPALLYLHVRDQGQGIQNIALAMQEGYSTATPEMREMGFGAGMGLPNIKKNADRFEISSQVGEGTSLDIYFDLRGGGDGRP
jgi:anti-sigma regulatory factor (Ser/Thr protein kinase)